MFRPWFCLFLLSFAWICPSSAPARGVRVASYNVRQGVGAVSSAEYQAVKQVLMRVDADIVAFQELTTADRPNWEALAQELGYQTSVYSPWTGLSGNLYTGYFSRWPILESHSVRSPSGANEISRPPLHVKVDVPDTRYPLGLWTLHHKALSGSKNEFRRSVEGYRTAEDIDAYLAENPGCTEYVVLGDFNDDVDQSQTDQFFSLPSGLPSSYQLGADISFPVPYRTFPRDAYEVSGGGMKMLEAFHEDSSIDTTFVNSSGRLDYIFASDTIQAHPLGGGSAEVYNSARDDGVGGLPKAGLPLPASTSATASDHYLIFADIQLQDAVPPGDEVPGAWRLVHFGHSDPQAGDLSRAHDDADSDTYSNLDEYIAGTDPRNPKSVPSFASIVPSALSIELSLSTLTGRVYSIEYSDRLSEDPGTWQELPAFTEVAGTGSHLVHTDGIPASGFRAYRLRIKLEP